MQTKIGRPVKWLSHQWLADFARRLPTGLSTLSVDNFAGRRDGDKARDTSCFCVFRRCFSVPRGAIMREFLQKNHGSRGLISLKCAVTLRQTPLWRAMRRTGRGEGFRVARWPSPRQTMTPCAGIPGAAPAARRRSGAQRRHQAFLRAGVITITIRARCACLSGV
jgi:hypothetical protein